VFETHAAVGIDLDDDGVHRLDVKSHEIADFRLQISD
jgi:hypothetical protein